MTAARKPTRAYRAPRREEAAARTREAIVASAKRTLEDRGWSGATVKAIAAGARVSPKTVEAVFGTKAALLRASVDYALRGDVDPTPMPGRDAIRRMEEAPTATAMLDLHAAHLRRVNERSARIAGVVEHAAATDDVAAELWREMNANRRFAVRWAARTLLGKRGAPSGLARRDAETVFWVALDWATFRTLVGHAGLTPGAYELWLRRYYAAMLLRRPLRAGR